MFFTVVYCCNLSYSTFKNSYRVIGLFWFPNYDFILHKNIVVDVLRCFKGMFKIILEYVVAFLFLYALILSPITLIFIWTQAPNPKDFVCGKRCAGFIESILFLITSWRLKYYRFDKCEASTRTSSPSCLDKSFST